MLPTRKDDSLRYGTDEKNSSNLLNVIRPFFITFTIIILHVRPCTKDGRAQPISILLQRRAANMSIKTNVNIGFFYSILDSIRIVQLTWYIFAYWWNKNQFMSVCDHRRSKMREPWNFYYKLTEYERHCVGSVFIAADKDILWVSYLKLNLIYHDFFF